jgi:hypothetical protein
VIAGAAVDHVGALGDLSDARRAGEASFDHHGAGAAHLRTGNRQRVVLELAEPRAERRAHEAVCAEHHRTHGALVAAWRPL